MDVKIIIDGVDKESFEKSTNQDYYGFIANDRTYVPLRFISESLGYKVDYDNKTKNITISDASTKVEMNVNSKNFKVNGKKKSMDVKAILYNDRTYLPIRYIGESFDKLISWDRKNKTCYVGHGLNYNGENLSKLKKLDFSKYGFELFVDKDFENKIISEFNDKNQEVNFYAKGLYKKGSLDGNIASVALSNEAAYYPGTNIYYENGKVLTLARYSENFLNKTNPGTKYDTEAAKEFSKAIILPSKNIFPNFNLENINKSKDYKEFQEIKQEKAKNKDSNYEIYEFGNPKIRVKIPKDLMKDIVVEKNPNNSKIMIYDSLHYADRNKSHFPGLLLLVHQYNYTGSTDMFDEFSKHINTQNGKRTVASNPRDLNFDPNNKTKSNHYNKTLQRLNNELIYEVEE